MGEGLKYFKQLQMFQMQTQNVYQLRWVLPVPAVALQISSDRILCPVGLQADSICSVCKGRAPLPGSPRLLSLELTLALSNWMDWDLKPVPATCDVSVKHLLCTQFLHYELG